MTEEKENCIFQQNYNVFGLDDKPCCYLYHKYCEEIDNCYFKRCKRLEQENRELKKQIESQKGLITVSGKQQYEITMAYDKCKTALEEIKNILDKECSIVSNAKAVGIINEVLNA